MIRPACIVMLATAIAHGDTQVPESVRAHATRRTTAVTIDGNLDEAAWKTASRQGSFVQRFPKDGAKASQQTEFALLYDDDAIYVGVWAHDTEPELIRPLLTRRDIDAVSDAIVVGIDSYHDRRTAYVFQLNAAGVQRDMLVFDDAMQDDTWDAVWTGDAALTTDGWTAEFRIPLNQLRFPDSEHHEWGFQLLRIVARSQEQSTWSPWPRSGPQIVSRFGIVDGIENVKPSRRLELLPYATAGVEQRPVDAGDPINSRASPLGNAGLDLKYGLGPAFTLSATLNPDFGQVEADPSQVNLGATELFFAEKRPFFIEGVDLFKLPIGNGDNLIEGAFYSRRIGAAPDAPDANYDYIRAPSSTTIYGAAKLTGKTRGGWSVGLLDAVTGEETATIVDSEGMQSAPIVAPLTNYSVARIKRDFREGKTTIGASATSVNRAVGETPLAMTLHDQAYTTGAQFNHRWDDNAWELTLGTVGSFVHGTPEAISETQQSNRHLFQRPDAPHVHLDEMRTSLSGAGLTWGVGRSGETKHWRWAHGGDLRTPGLELNDAGFMMFADRFEPWVWGEYREDEPGDTVNNWRTQAVGFVSTNLEPRLLTYGANLNINAQLTNYWSFNAGANLQMGGWDPVELRGGPALRTDTRLSGRVGVGTDYRKPVRGELSMGVFRNWIADSIFVDISSGVTVQARSNIDITVGPTWFERTDPLQYIDQVDDDVGQRHYIFGRISQTTFALTTRVNWTFSPKLSLQVYAQPFVAAGTYSEFKDVNDPHAQRFADRFDVLEGTDYTINDGVVYVNHNGSYAFDHPDFDVRNLRSTVVLRWEYRPGSTVFAIWSHGQSNSDASRFDLGNDLANLARASGENIVMVKANYWIGL